MKFPNCILSERQNKEQTQFNCIGLIFSEGGRMVVLTDFFPPENPGFQVHEQRLQGVTENKDWLPILNIATGVVENCGDLHDPSEEEISQIRNTLRGEKDFSLFVETLRRRIANSSGVEPLRAVALG